jgi:hypothetical protein
MAEHQLVSGRREQILQKKYAPVCIGTELAQSLTDCVHSTGFGYIVLWCVILDKQWIQKYLSVAPPSPKALSASTSPHVCWLNIWNALLHCDGYKNVNYLSSAISKFWLSVHQVDNSASVLFSWSLLLGVSKVWLILKTH